MMIWPFCQFAIHITDKPEFQLFYLKLAFIDTSLLSVGWLVFTFFLTGQSQFLRRRGSLALFIPVLLVAITVIINPKGMFVTPLDGSYIIRSYGTLFWLSITVLTCYIISSLYIMYLAFISDKSPRIKKQVKYVLLGILVMITFILLDVFFNVVLGPFLPIIPGLTSFGILLSAIFFIIAIHRDKVLDIVTIAHQDIIDTISHGILVLDDYEIVLEINQLSTRHLDIHLGDNFDITTIFQPQQSVSQINLFLQAYRNHPLEKVEIELVFNYNEKNLTIRIHVAPIIVGGNWVGRIISFEDVSELRSLINETKLQNEILQERNHALTVIQDELFQTNQKLQLMAITDSLTGCYNRHYLTQQLEQELVKNMHNRIPFAILLIDIDHFKTVNDTYGHLIGDEVICSTVGAIQMILRQDDILARYGGEEFIIYLPHTGPMEATALAERVRLAVESNKLNPDNITQALSITVSMGVLSIHNFKLAPVDSPKIHLNNLFESVDKALYQAKKAGRNRIVSVVR